MISLIEFAVAIGTANVFVGVVNGLQQTFVGQRHRQGESIIVLYQSVHVFADVETLVRDVVLPRDIQEL